MHAYIKVLVKGLASHVDIVAAYFARELHTETVQLPEPVRDGLAVPVEGQLERVVDAVFCGNRLVVFVSAELALLRLVRGFLFAFRRELFEALFHRLAGLALNVCLCVFADIAQEFEVS